MIWENKIRTAIGMVALSALAACGGGGDGDGTDESASGSTPVATAEGLYTGTTDIGQSMTGLVLDNGNYWVLYSEPNNSAALGGVIQGTSNSSSGTFTSSDGRDFNFEGLGINNVSIAGTYAAGQSIAGKLDYGRGQPTAFTGTYDARYTQPATLAAIAGSYTGQSATAGDNEPASFTVSPTGSVSGVGATGCRFTGNVSPRGTVAVYDLSLSFLGGICEQGSATINGVAYLDADGKRLFAAALDASRSNGAVFVGAKEAAATNGGGHIQ